MKSAVWAPFSARMIFAVLAGDKGAGGVKVAVDADPQSFL
jgi:hypothetical protein